MLDQDSQAPNNAPLRVKQHIHDLNMFNNDSVMIWSTAISSIENNLNKIHLSATLLNKFTSTYYYDKNDYFGFFRNI